MLFPNIPSLPMCPLDWNFYKAWVFLARSHKHSEKKLTKPIYYPKIFGEKERERENERIFYFLQDTEMVTHVQVTLMAIPFRSELALAAVADVLGTVFVLVSLMWILVSGISSDLAATFRWGEKYMHEFSVWILFK